MSCSILENLNVSYKIDYKTKFKLSSYCSHDQNSLSCDVQLGQSSRLLYSTITAEMSNVLTVIRFYCYITV